MLRILKHDRGVGEDFVERVQFRMPRLEERELFLLARRIVGLFAVYRGTICRGFAMYRSLSLTRPRRRCRSREDFVPGRRARLTDQCAR